MALPAIVESFSNSKTIMNIGLPEVLLIALVVLLLFGGKKIPELMKGLGKGVKSFKDGINGIDEEIKDSTKLDSKKDEPDAKQ
jgi:sec-independent protein translocase protein TatA